MRKLLSIMLVAALLITAVVPAFGQDRPSIPELLAGEDLGSFQTLLLAAQLTGLDAVLSGDGPYTVLAPTDEAFAAALETLGLTAEEAIGDPELVTSILSYHVIPGRYFFRQLTAGPTLETALTGESVTFNLEAGAFTVNGVAISNPDNLASNGIVHVIDGVLLPSAVAAAMAPATEAPAETTEAPAETAAAPARPLIPEVLAAGELGSFTTLLAAAEAAGLVETLSSEGPFTIFAPTDDAFAALLDEVDLTAEDVLASPELLAEILLYHVVPGQYFFRNLASDPTLPTALADQSVAVSLEGRVFTVNGVAITDVDNVAGNGVIFVIDGVLLTDAQRATLTPSGASLRLAHFSPDAGAVDVYINGEIKAEAVEFGTISEVLAVRPGVYDLQVVPTGSEAGDSSFKTNIAEGDFVTVAASGLVTNETLRLNVLREDYSAVAADRVRLSVFHGIEAAGAVDVFVNGQLLIGALGYPGSLGNNDGFDIREVGAGTYDVQVRLAGTDTVVIDAPGATFVGGTNVLIAAVGTPDRPSLAIRALPTS